MTDPTPPRRFRFGLRSLFVLVTVASGVIALAINYPFSLWFTGWSVAGCGIGKARGDGIKGALLGFIFSVVAIPVIAVIVILASYVGLLPSVQ